jgi:hypothetical protein
MRWDRLIVIAMVFVGLSACNKNMVRMKYQHHISAGEVRDLSNNVIPTPKGTYWALFHIVCLINEGKKAQTFHFSPLKLHTNDEDETIQNPANQLVGLTNTITLQPGQRVAFPGSVIFRMSGASAGGQPRYLLYASSGKESVLPYKDNFGNLGGPTLYLASLPQPAYAAGADPCEDPPIQKPH